MVAGIQALNFFNKPISSIGGVGERFATSKAHRVEGAEGVTTPYRAIASTNCELNPDVTGGGYTHGVGAFASNKNWIF